MKEGAWFAPSALQASRNLLEQLQEVLRHVVRRRRSGHGGLHLDFGGSELRLLGRDVDIGDRRVGRLEVFDGCGDRFRGELEAAFLSADAGASRRHLVDSRVDGVERAGRIGLGGYTELLRARAGRRDRGGRSVAGEAEVLQDRRAGRGRIVRVGGVDRDAERARTVADKRLKKSARDYELLTNLMESLKPTKGWKTTHEASKTVGLALANIVIDEREIEFNTEEERSKIVNDHIQIVLNSIIENSEINKIYQAKPKKHSV